MQTQNEGTAKRYKKLSYRLENRASAWCIHLMIIMLISGIWVIEFSAGFLAKIHGNGRMRVYKNSNVL